MAVDLPCLGLRSREVVAGRAWRRNAASRVAGVASDLRAAIDPAAHCGPLDNGAAPTNWTDQPFAFEYADGFGDYVPGCLVGSGEDGLRRQRRASLVFTFGDASPQVIGNGAVSGGHGRTLLPPKYAPAY